MIIQLPGLLNIIIDFIIWLLVHVFVSLSTWKLRQDSFNPDSWLYQERRWENCGDFYKTFFKVKKWKEFLPDGAAVSKGGFRKKNLGNHDPAYIRKFIIETCRAELTHWIIFIFSIIFFIWNEWWIGLIMVVYAIIVNLPCVITQRYNRIRLRRVYRTQVLSSDSGTLKTSSS